MEITLIQQADQQVLVVCDGRPSHTFDLLILIPDVDEGPPQPLDDPVTYGKAIYSALFPKGTPTRLALEEKPDRILLVTTTRELDAIPWEYAYGRYGFEASEDFLILDCHFLRGLPANQRIDPSVIDSGLHIVAIPSNPLHTELEPLNIDGEWTRLIEIVKELPYAIILERTRPPTLERLGLLVSSQKNLIVHFMGHGGQNKESGSILCFEQENGELARITAKDFIRQVRGSAFLVTLNACVSAMPSETYLSNLAASLVMQKTPYALGMRFSIRDDDALAFSRTFYSFLARGASVEDSVYQVRLALSRGPHLWTIGVPVLYTALSAPATGFVCIKGTPTFIDSQPKIEVSALPRAEGAFEGRIQELITLGDLLTGDNRPPLVTIHGGGGQGKTTLAHEFVERFGYAWPGGVWATSLENLPSREVFANDLARFLGIDGQKKLDSNDTERLVTHQLALRRTLIVLDNAETLIEAVEANNEEAIRLAQFIREHLPRPPVTLLATSRSFLGWAGEIGCELTGIAASEGVRLFQQNVPQRLEEIDKTLLWELSERVEGHPLSLRLLGSAFNTSSDSFSAFVEAYEANLMHAEDKYKDIDHRHRTLYASIETSVRYLDADLRALLSGLWVFHAPFSPQIVTPIFAPGIEPTESQYSLIESRFSSLWHHGLLIRVSIIIGDGTLHLYRLLPMMRSFIEQRIEQIYKHDILLARFGAEYAKLVQFLRRDLDYNSAAVFIAQQSREDIERGANYVRDIEQASYLLNWGWVLHRLGDVRHGLRLTERTLEIVQGVDQPLEMQALFNLALMFYAISQPQHSLVFSEKALSIAHLMKLESRENTASILSMMGLAYVDTEQPKRALALFEQTLSIAREIGDQDGEAISLNNVALAYHNMGHLEQALAMYEQALPIAREVGNRKEEATVLDNMAQIYRDTGHPKQALMYFKQALSIQREVGDLDGEAVTSRNLALTYEVLGQSQGTLELYEQALSIERQIGDQRGEATSLRMLGLMYHKMGQPQLALALYEQSLPISREIGNRSGECSILCNMASIYSDIGHPQHALALFEQALLIAREIGDRKEEATALNNMIGLFLKTGQPQYALAFAEQALPIAREIGDRGGEASVLNNMALTYNATGQLKQALAFYEQALPIAREVGDKRREAAILQNIALIYRDMGQAQRALALIEQSLSIEREIGNRAGEASTLNSLAGMHRILGQRQQALKLYKQALSIRREVGDRAGEATTLNNIGRIYHIMGRTQQALKFYEQALSILREVGDRAGEATTLNNLAGIYHAKEQIQQALKFYEQALSIRREVGDRAGEATTLKCMAAVLYQPLNRFKDAIDLMEQAIAVLVETGLTQDAAGETVDQLREHLKNMRQQVQLGSATDHPKTQVVAAIQSGTAASGSHSIEVSEEIIRALHEFINAEDWESTRRVVEARQALLFRAEVEAIINQNIAHVKSTGNEQAEKMLEMHLAVLRNCKQRGIAETFEQLKNAQEDFLPFDAEFITRSIAALLGDPQEKMAHELYLTTMGAQTTDEELKALINTIQLALFGGDLSQHSQNLNGVYRQAWETIVAVVETGGVDPRLLALITNETLAALGPAADQRDRWRDQLLEIKAQATEGNAQGLIALIDAVIGLLDAGGDPAGLGEGLRGVYARAWQAIVEGVSDRH